MEVHFLHLSGVSRPTNVIPGQACARRNSHARRRRHQEGWVDAFHGPCCGRCHPALVLRNHSISSRTRVQACLPCNANLGDPATYHLTWTYSDVDGSSWTYVDTGVIRVFELDGDVYVSLSGRSTNVGPDGTGWVGHWQLNTSTSHVWSAGLGVGPIDQLACNELA